MNISTLINPRGANYRQLNAIKRLLVELINESAADTENNFHHSGDKSNLAVHSIAKTLGFNIRIHPTKTPDITDGIVLPSVTNTERNRNLVDSSDIVIGIPMVVFEYEDSPLVKTVNYAIARGKEVYLLSPKGNVYQVWNTKDNV